MTNKSLSQQLCEACGIKPKYRCKNVPCLNFMADSEICRLKDGFTKCNPEICENDYTPDTNHRNWKEAKPIYPDFTKSANFLKLEEIMLTELAKHRLTVVKWVHYLSDNTLMYEYILITKTGHKIRFKHNEIQVDNWFVERENRADCLILFILWKVIPICGDAIKQAIKNEQWKE